MVFGGVWGFMVFMIVHNGFVVSWGFLMVLTCYLWLLIVIVFLVCFLWFLVVPCDY